nr:PE-PGRS family protein PE_PGRS33-like [Aegilops tauschii subsp. strangulata]
MGTVAGAGAARAWRHSNARVQRPASRCGGAERRARGERGTGEAVRDGALGNGRRDACGEAEARPRGRKGDARPRGGGCVDVGTRAAEKRWPRQEATAAEDGREAGAADVREAGATKGSGGRGGSARERLELAGGRTKMVRSLVVVAAGSGGIEHGAGGALTGDADRPRADERERTRFGSRIVQSCGTRPGAVSVGQRGEGRELTDDAGHGAVGIVVGDGDDATWWRQTGGEDEAGRRGRAPHVNGLGGLSGHADRRVMGTIAGAGAARTWRHSNARARRGEAAEAPVSGGRRGDAEGWSGARRVSEARAKRLGTARTWKRTA